MLPLSPNQPFVRRLFMVHLSFFSLYSHLKSFPRQSGAPVVGTLRLSCSVVYQIHDGSQGGFSFFVSGMLPGGGGGRASGKGCAKHKPFTPAFPLPSPQPSPNNKGRRTPCAALRISFRFTETGVSPVAVVPRLFGRRWTEPFQAVTFGALATAIFTASVVCRDARMPRSIMSIIAEGISWHGVVRSRLNMSISSANVFANTWLQFT